VNGNAASQDQTRPDQQAMHKCNTNCLLLALVWCFLGSAAGESRNGAAALRDAITHTDSPLTTNTNGNSQTRDALVMANTPAASYVQALLQISRPALHAVSVSSRSVRKLQEKEENEQAHNQGNSDADLVESADTLGEGSLVRNSKENASQDTQSGKDSEDSSGPASLDGRAAIGHASADPRRLQSNAGEGRPQDDADRANGGMSITIPETEMKKRTDLKDKSHLFEKVDNANRASAKLPPQPRKRRRNLKRRKHHASATAMNMKGPNESTATEESEDDPSSTSSSDSDFNFEDARR